jgi:opacity protein-like surface antigen
MKPTLALAAALALASGAALADVTQEVIDGLKAGGFERIEIQRSPTTLKVEATRGTEKLEQIIDRATGAILKQETETLRPGERLSDALSIRDRDRIGGGRRGGDDDDDDSGRDDDDDRDDDSSGHGSDDDGDDRSGHGGRGDDDSSGHDSDDDDDDGSGHGGRGDDDGDDD